MPATLEVLASRYDMQREVADSVVRELSQLGLDGSLPVSELEMAVDIWEVQAVVVKTASVISAELDKEPPQERWEALILQLGRLYGKCQNSPNKVAPYFKATGHRVKKETGAGINWRYLAYLPAGMCGKCERKVTDSPGTMAFPTVGASDDAIGFGNKYSARVLF